MIAIVTAGGEIEANEPLYAVTHGGLKAMVDINGKPMVQWVLDALCASSEIDHVMVVGLPPETNLDCACPLDLLPDQGDMFSNIRKAAKESLRNDPQAGYAVLASANIPALRSEMVDWLMCQTRELDQDIYFSVIERATLENDFPESRRNFMHLKNMQVCNGDLHCFRLQAAVEETPFWKQLIESRKSPFRPASFMGYNAQFFLMLRQLTLKDAETNISKRLGIKGRAVVSPYAEIGWEINKPAQLEFMREYLYRRNARNTADTQPD